MKLSKIKEIIKTGREAGLNGDEIAAKLNEVGSVTPTKGTPWNQGSVNRWALKWKLGRRRKVRSDSKGGRKSTYKKRVKTDANKVHTVVSTDMRVDALLDLTTSTVAVKHKEYIAKLIAKDIANG